MAPHSPAVKHPSRAPAIAGPRIGKAAAPAPAQAQARKIRIVHVLAPEVIKTDARHFRELVQRLTGMPKGGGGGASSSSSTPASSSESAGESSSSLPAAGGSPDPAPAVVAPPPAETKGEAAASPAEEEGLAARALGEVEAESNDAFFQGLEDFLLNGDEF
ncbi:skin secretory protein xP2 [Brachypodium distachyon]|uniref:VQ domain-containing protein n=1 Tax=Brachypodium distachyon TaxID=15368 RepID=I1J336_BRADI|nr:skin secretory protein xP2 [Brachypodium distachyon]KQJ85171.1 hypothetical protein BRADI_5g25360v3 [Brachypodium distachyon]|eukprot:XP_014751210.1 skin secretory protein xP2 [Brachypodium distachyon]